MKTSSRSRWFLAAALAALFILPAVATAALHASGSPDVSFTAVGPAGLRITGNTHELAVLDDGTNVTIEVPLGHLTTGIELRDRHMKDHLGVQQHRTAELTVARAALQFPTGGTVSASARGKLKLHGRERDVSFRYTAERHGNAIRVSASVKVKMTAFGIEVPSYLGVTVQPDVDVRVRFQVSDQ